MSHTINMLAKRNIQKYKKHYLIVSIVLLIVSTLIFSSSFIVDNLYQACIVCHGIQNIMELHIRFYNVHGIL